MKQTSLIQSVSDFALLFPPPVCSFSGFFLCVRVHSGEHGSPRCRAPCAPCTCLASALRTSLGRVQEIWGALHVLQSCCYCVEYKAQEKGREGTVFFSSSLFEAFNAERGTWGDAGGASHKAKKNLIKSIRSEVVSFFTQNWENHGGRNKQMWCNLMCNLSADWLIGEHHTSLSDFIFGVKKWQLFQTVYSDSCAGEPQGHPVGPERPHDVLNCKQFVSFCFIRACVRNFCFFVAFFACMPAHFCIWWTSITSSECRRGKRAVRLMVCTNLATGWVYFLCISVWITYLFNHSGQSAARSSIKLWCLLLIWLIELSSFVVLFWHPLVCEDHMEKVCVFYCFYFVSSLICSAVFL